MSQTEDNLKEYEESEASACTIFKRLSDIVKEHFIYDGINAGDIDITSDTDPRSTLGADSLDMLELIMATEIAFGLDIPDRDVADFTTIGDFVDYLREKRLQKK